MPEDEVVYSATNSTLLENLMRNRHRWLPVFAVVIDVEGSTMAKFDSAWFNDDKKEIIIGLFEYWIEMFKKGVDKPLIKNVH